jgi:1-aminocyclopropane-1-carboxylate deaminase/D-cysteine desulfhydrase-like pyridoxal-dependent ACC family enzyme
MTTTITPLQQVCDFLLERDDLFEVAGVHGGKARSCWAMAQGATGLVTLSHRHSPQSKIVAHVARELGVPCRVHTPTGRPTPELEAARAAGAVLVPHRGGYTNVLSHHAINDAESRGWRLIPFGMEGEQAVQQMAAEARATVAQMHRQGVTARRVVVPVGSGISLAGILHGFARAGFVAPVVGVTVGSDPAERLNKWAPSDWPVRCQIVPGNPDFGKPAPDVLLCNVQLDPFFEAKCKPVLKPGDLLWLIAVR